MLDDLCDPSIIETSWMIASQMGKTLCLILACEYYIDQDPSDILVVYPTLDSAKAWIKEKFMPTLEETPRVAMKISPSKMRDSENTILNKHYPGGILTAAGANSPSTLRQRSKRIVIQDEIDAYELNPEGDPEEQADARAKNFFNAVKLKSSTPTLKNGSRVENRFDRSDKQYLFCRCPRCEHWAILRWASVRWPKGKPEDAIYECEQCKGELTDQERIQMVLGGEWRNTAPFNGYRGRHLSGLYRVIGKKTAFRTYLHEFAQDWLSACEKGDASKRVIINTFLAETWEVTAERISETEIAKRAEKYKAELPAGVLCLVGAVDVQADRLEYQVVGFGVGEEAWAVDFQRIFGNPHLPQVWKELDQVILKKYKHELGHSIGPAIVFIDSGGQSRGAGFNRPVYQYTKPRQSGMVPRGVWACKGRGTAGIQIRREYYGSKKGKHGGIALQVIGTDEAKSLFYSRLKIENPGPGFVHFPKNQIFDDEYFKQVTAEKIIPEKRMGIVTRKWEKIREKNEALDLWAYAYAALDKLNPHWPTLAARYAKRDGQEQKPEEQKPTPQKPQRRLVRRVPFRPMRMRF